MEPLIFRSEYVHYGDASLSRQSDYIILGSVAVIGYLSVLIFTAEIAGTYIGVELYGSVVALGTVLGILARQRSRLRFPFVALVNTSRFLVVYSGAAVISGYGRITFPFGNLGFGFFSLSFGAYAVFYLVYVYGFKSRTHRYIFDWIGDRQVVPQQIATSTRQ
jgi:hypothetical protein